MHASKCFASWSMPKSVSAQKSLDLISLAALLTTLAITSWYFPFSSKHSKVITWESGYDLHDVYKKKQGKAFIDVLNGTNSPPGPLAIPQKLISKHKRIKSIQSEYYCIDHPETLQDKQAASLLQIRLEKSWFSHRSWQRMGTKNSLHMHAGASHKVQHESRRWQLQISWLDLLLLGKGFRFCYGQSHPWQHWQMVGMKMVTPSHSSPSWAALLSEAWFECYLPRCHSTWHTRRRSWLWLRLCCQ